MKNGVFTRWPDDILMLKSCNCVDFGLFIHYLYEKYRYIDCNIDNAIGYVFIMQDRFVPDTKYPDIYGHSIPMIKNVLSDEVFIIDFGGILDPYKSRISKGMIYGPFDSFEDAVNEYSGYVSIEKLGYMSELNDDDKRFYSKKYFSKPILSNIVLYSDELKDIDKFYGSNISQLNLLLKIQRMKLFLNKIFVDKARVNGFMELPIGLFKQSGFIKYTKQNTKLMVNKLKSMFVK